MKTIYTFGFINYTHKWATDSKTNVSDQMQKTALLKCKSNEDIYIIEDTSFHEGIIGLVAGALCFQDFNVLPGGLFLAKNEQGYKASMRSPEGFNCMEFLGPYKHFVVFGGHENAAGFSLNLNEFVCLKISFMCVSRNIRIV